MALSNKISFFLFLLLSFFFFSLDQISKFFIKLKFPEQLGSSFRTMSGEYEIPIIEPFLMIKRISNKGIAFGLDGDGDFSTFLTSVTIILTFLIIYALFKASKNSSLALKLSLSLILGGALGNLYDRIIYGEVVDFIGLFQNIFPFIFNLADTFVSIGMFTLYSVRRKVCLSKKLHMQKNGRRKNKII